MQRLPRRATTLTALTLLLAACGAGPTDRPPTPPPTPAVTPSPTPPGPTEVPTVSASPPPFTCGESVQQPGSVPLALITGFSVANEGATGRITFTFRPAGNVAATPDVEIRPATPPFTRDPSGLPLEVAGSDFLVIVLRGGTALDADFNPTFEGPFDATPAGGPIVDVRRAGDFEAVSSWVVGLDGPPCVRVLPPDGTSRLVIEIEVE
jgi:hypothetical protein